MAKLIPVTIDKKLVSLVILVSFIGIGLTVFVSFHYANLILEERVMNQLRGESGVRGDSISSILTGKTQQIQVITSNPMIKKSISQMNQITDQELLADTISQKRIDFLIEVQAFEASIGGLNDLENVEVIGIDGHRLFALINTKNPKNFLIDPVFIKGSKESFTQLVQDKNNKRKI
ncbi:MAG TPA: hypothetical protein HA350_00015, partial [Candidatus Nitrosotenuis sp.]|nr:hypothetical protein [Candidatus Nitrosotenuis sp.]